MQNNTAELITKAKNLVVDEITYKSARLNKRGGKNVALQKDGKKLIVQFPKLTTWGLNERVDDTTGRVSYDLNLQFDDTPSSQDFLEKVKQLQEKLLDDSVIHCKEWFGKNKMSREVAENLMYPLLRYPKNKETQEFDYTRHPTMKLKVPYWDEKFSVELYDSDKNMVFDPNSSDNLSTPLDLVPSRSKLKGLIENGGIWFAGGRYGVTWKLLQAQIETPVTIKGFCMLDDSDDDEDKSSDSEQEVKPKKKVVRKKKKKKVSAELNE